MKEKSNIILFPELERLNKRLYKLKDILSELLTKKDFIVFVVNKNIEAIYNIECAALYYELDKNILEYKRLRKILHLIQIEINHERKVNIDTINNKIDKDIFDYNKLYKDYLDKINKALDHCSSDKLTDKESTEIKDAYRKIVKIIHPDINPDITPEEEAILRKTTIYYKNGMLTEIKAILEVVLSGSKFENNKKANIEEVKEDIIRLKKLISIQKSEIKKIKNSYPYIYKSLLKDRNKLEQHKNDLKENSNIYKEYIVLLNKKIEELIKKHG